MFELLLMYKYVMVAGAFMAAALSLIGCQLAARDRSMQTICVAQGSNLGVIIGIGIAGVGDSIIPFLIAALMTILVYFGTNVIGSKISASKNTYFCGVYIIIFSLGYLGASVIPGLESHIVQIFFGDLVTLSDKVAFNITVFSVVILVFNIVFWRKITSDSFNEAIFGGHVLAVKNGFVTAFFNIFTIGAIVFSIQQLGFVFTISSLFVPSIALGKRSGLKTHLLSAAALGFIGTIFGFLLSINYTILPTVPTITLMMLAFGSLFRLRVYQSMRR